MHYYMALTALGLLSLLPGCSSISYSKFREFLNKTPVTQSPPPITIWVHGTKAFFSKYFLQNFFFCYPGLNPAESFAEHYHLHEIAATLHRADPKNFFFDTFYFFGWSGELSYEARQDAAKQLYKELLELREQYKERFACEPTIRVITHSHGGNVALQLAEFCTDQSLCIEELVLLAIPVQKKTSPYAQHPMFKKIYSIYSGVDSIQVMDPQGFHYWRKYRNKSFAEKIQSPFFSERTFEPQDNMSQVKIKIKRRGIAHVEFLLNHFLKKLPEILQKADANTAKNGRNHCVINV